MLDLVPDALLSLATGGVVVVVDDDDRENEGDLVMAAAFAATEQTAFFLRHGSGIICAPMPDEPADRLDLPAMVGQNTDLHGTAFTVSVDHRSAGSGISAHDRTTTLRALADAATVASDLRRPGHVFPLRARAGGVLERRGHTEAAVDLLTMAGLSPVAMITELVGDDGVPMAGVSLTRFAEEHGLVVVSVGDIACRRRATGAVTLTGRAPVALRGQTFVASSYRSEVDGVEHVAMTLGDVATECVRPNGVLTRVHSECLTGDVFGSARCDCGAQLSRAIDLIIAEGAGVIIYLRGHEGRGIGLGPKLRAYALQDDGLDTVDANSLLGLPVDARNYGVAAAILADLRVRRVALLTNNPAKWTALAEHDVELVRRVETDTFVTAENLRYLRTKRDRMGHHIHGLPEVNGSNAAASASRT